MMPGCCTASGFSTIMRDSMKQVYLNKTDCSGCTACSHMCPEEAITMEPDQEGFLYPVINQDLCSGCGCCTEICSFTHHQNLKNKGSQACFSCISKEETVLKASTSGGAFTALSDSILDQGGVVYGADFDEEFKVYHSRAVTKTERDRQRVSKYAQSNLHQVFHQVEADLNEGRRVLFTGTPCQIAGLKSCIPESLAENLILCDLICHSVPSPLIWKEYKEWLERKYSGKLSKVMFRSKIHPWTRENSNRGFLFELEEEPDILHEDDRFYDLFFKAGTIARPSCENCKFTDRNRVGDITIADYWGIEEYSPETYTPLGVSVVLINNQKGKSLLREMMQKADMVQRSIEESLTHQQRLSQPVKYPAWRKKFWEELENLGFDFIMEKYATQWNET